MSPLALVFVVAISALALVWLRLARSDEVFAARIEEGKVSLRRGRISPALLTDFGDVVIRVPNAKGWARCVRGHPRPELVIEDLPDDVAQRLRNVFALHALRVLREASIEAPSRRGARFAIALLVLIAIGLAIATLRRG